MTGRNLHTLVSSYLCWPLLHGPWRAEKWLARRYYREKTALAALPLERRMRAAEARLGALLRWAGTTVPYWRQWFSAAGLSPAKLDKPFEVLRSLPVTGRELLQETPSLLRSERCEGLFPLANHSGGSTGTPLEFITCRQSRSRVMASAWYADSTAGWYPGAGTAYLWGADREVRSRRTLAGSLKLAARNVRLFNAFDITEDRLLAAHRSLNRRPPEVLIGYAGSLHLLARLLRQRDEKPAYPRKAVISSAETLTGDMREDLERVFGADKVYNRYGCREVGLIAHECPEHGGLHVNIDDLVVEVVDERGEPVEPGQVGRVLVSSLHGSAMPLIRYELGDLAEWATQPCSCGDKSPLLSRIAGRRSDTIRTTGGRLVHGEYFTHLFYGHTAAVRRFQFIQRGPARYLLRYQAAGPLPVQVEAALRLELAAQLGDDSDIEFERCERIEPSPSGKHRFTISLLDEQRNEKV